MKVRKERARDKIYIRKKAGGSKKKEEDEGEKQET